MSTRISIHQPMYLPYPGLFNKMKNVDIFVFGDDAQYSRRYYYNRNRIKTPNGALMLTVPLIKPFGKKLNEIKIDNNKNWQKKHLKSLYTWYKKADYFEDYIKFFEEVYNTEWQTLHELNMKTLFYLMEQLDIKVKVYFTSDLLRDYTPTGKTQRIIDICKKLNANVYLSGIGGKNYLEPILFEKNKIKLEFQNYKPKEYKQLWGPFIPNLSVVDLLFNLGEKATDMI